MRQHSLVDVGPVCFHSTLLLPATLLFPRPAGLAHLAATGFDTFLACSAYIGALGNNLSQQPYCAWFACYPQLLIARM